MEGLSRRRWLASITLAGLGRAVAARPVARCAGGGEAAGAQPQGKLALEDYEPKSMLHVPAHKIARARFPAIDFHTHLSWSGRFGEAEHPHFNAKPGDVLPVIARKNVRAMVNLTGGYGKALEETVGVLRAADAERFLVFTEPWYTRVAEADYPKFQADQIGRAREVGARAEGDEDAGALPARARAGGGALEG